MIGLCESEDLRRPTFQWDVLGKERRNASKTGERSSPNEQVSTNLSKTGMLVNTTNDITT